SRIALLQQGHRQPVEGLRTQVHVDAAVSLQAQFVNHNLSDKLSAGTGAPPEAELSLVICGRVVARDRQRIGTMVEVHRSVEQNRSASVELRQGGPRAVLQEQHAPLAG